MSLRFSTIKAVIMSISIALGGAITYLYFSPRQTVQVQEQGQTQILEYESARDKQDIINLMKKNWYWLISSPDYSAEYMLDNQIPSHREPRYKGALRVKVLRDSKNLLGFTAYYKLNFYEGRVLFLAVDETQRGKGYGELLMRHALSELKKLGSYKICLDTRVDNLKAQSLYKRIGFIEESRDDAFVHFIQKPE